MKHTTIQTVPHCQQRYNTTGDYQTVTENERCVSVSDLQNESYEFLVAMHELIESFLCQQRHITDDDIDAFDMRYENQRLADDGLSEPGDDPAAPYHKEHVFATKIEKLLAEELGVDWDKYAAACAAKTVEWLRQKENDHRSE